ncbi:phosphoribosylaminoimidazole-succinocarboxamide synthase chloroplastic-like [Trifolium pratense]|uniref:phosphoribosylaminoimidazolesuccinocarboxamide synthase n=1 Tax=Trifolium pratense TaxID=57577 RepID=A0A2K3MGM8_TRIPR|nr:phosphoribosylaminoimidazole-succinocarboxamide synthase chloroplastic-like [Trifolium pratense]
MIDSTVSLNPPNNLHTKVPLKNFQSPAVFTSTNRITCRLHKFRNLKIRATAMRKESEQQPSFGDTLLNNTRKRQVIDAATTSLSNCLSETNLHLTVPALKSKSRGKVRDIYDSEDYLVLVTTDRQSAFDRVLASIPFKGQV